MPILLLGKDVIDNTAILYLGALGDFVPVDENQVLVNLMPHITWKRRLILLYMPLIHLSLLGPFTRCWCYWELTVLGQTTAFTIPGCRVRLPVSW